MARPTGTAVLGLETIYMSKHDTKKPHEIRPTFLGCGQVYCKTCGVSLTPGELAEMVQESVTRANALLMARHDSSPALDDEEGHHANRVSASSRR